LTTLTSKGATFSKAELSSSLEDGKPMLVAESNISEGEQILSIPDSLWLTQEAVKKSAIGKVVGELEPWTQLALLALVESGEPTSATQIVIPPFPSESESPLFWSSEELAELEGTQLLESTRGYM
jgi:[ribulose-bisphosphate carboxylase]-lysine N-methyltransferase